MTSYHKTTEYCKTRKSPASKKDAGLSAWYLISIITN